MSSLYTFRQGDREDIVWYATIDLIIQNIEFPQNYKHQLIYVAPQLVQQGHTEALIHSYYAEMADNLNATLPLQTPNEHINTLSASSKPTSIQNTQNAQQLANLLVTTDSITFTQNTQLENIITIMLHQAQFQKTKILDIIQTNTVLKVTTEKINSNPEIQILESNLYKLQTIEYYYNNLLEVFARILSQIKQSNDIALGDAGHPMSYSKFIDFTQIFKNIHIAGLIFLLFLVSILLLFFYFGIFLLLMCMPNTYTKKAYDYTLNIQTLLIKQYEKLV